jgi:cytochrome c-type biogenesis protein CcmH/NrfF
MALLRWFMPVMGLPLTLHLLAFAARRRQFQATTAESLIF